MKIMVVGLRGFPGAEVEVVTRSSYWDTAKPATHQGVKLTSVWSPSSTTLETFVHSFLAVLYAAYKRPDVLHLHAIGPAIFAPLARLFGLKVVVTQGCAGRTGAL